MIPGYVTLFIYSVMDPLVPGKLSVQNDDDTNYLALESSP